jgi:uncharacterized protein
VGKSTLLTRLTESESIVAAYEFTTLTCVPGTIKYKGAKIQLLDLPGIIEGAAEGEISTFSRKILQKFEENSSCTGKGRGRQVIATGRTADLVLMMLDATKGEVVFLSFFQIHLLFFLNFCRLLFYLNLLNLHQIIREIF